MDVGIAGSPYTLPATFTGTGASNGDAIRPNAPGAPRVVSAAEVVGAPRSYPIRHRTGAGHCPGPGDKAAGPNCPTSWSVETKNVSVVTNTRMAN